MRITIVSLLALLLSACGGGHRDSDSTPRPPPEPFALGVDVGTKQLIFHWGLRADVPWDATYYRLLENPDGHSGFTQVGDDIIGSSSSTRRDIAVHLFDFANALYILESCNNYLCSRSTELNAMNKDVDAIGYVKAINADAGDGFGSVTISGDGAVMAVGAPGEASAATGIGGDWNDNSIPEAGAVYVYKKTDSLWELDAYIKHTPGAQGFGSNLTLNFDGTVLAVGSNFGGSYNEPAAPVTLFHHDGSQWNQKTISIPASAGGVYGRSLSLSGDGFTLVVGDNGGGEYTPRVYLYKYDNGDWTDDDEILTPVTGTSAAHLSGFGGNVSISQDGATLAVGASFADPINSDPNDEIGNEAGAVYLFRLENGIWQEIAIIVPSILDDDERFGASLSLSADGETLVVGATREDGGGTGVEADPTDNLAANSGAAYVFRFNDPGWEQTAYLKASNTDAEDSFGAKVAINGDGSIIAVGAWNEDSSSVGVNGDQFDNSLDSARAVYVFKFDDVEWEQVSYLKPPAIDPFDGFARSISISSDGSTLAIGASGEDGSDRGFDGNPVDNSALSSGAVYLY